MPWEKITIENIGLIRKGDKIANGFPRAIVDADSRTGSAQIRDADIKVFIVNDINQELKGEYGISLATTIWSFSLEGLNHLSQNELLENWWWKRTT